MPETLPIPLIGDPSEIVIHQDLIDAIASAVQTRIPIARQVKELIIEATIEQLHNRGYLAVESTED